MNSEGAGKMIDNAARSKGATRRSKGAVRKGEGPARKGAGKMVEVGARSEPSLTVSLLCGLYIRMGLMVYGLWHDSTMEVKYTDIDYYVFTDAAQFITQGGSPYQHATYRYTPLLAWILQPNIWWSPLYGKILFILCDVLVGYLIYVIVSKKSTHQSTAIFCAEMWLLNPLPMTVSSRGNAESIMAVLVLATLYSFTNVTCMWCLSLCAMLYGLSVHTKIYPVTYALPMYLYLVNCTEHSNSGFRRRVRKYLGFDVLPNGRTLLFAMISGLLLLGLTFVCYHWCGMEFIQETYLYHITRRDTRHNFSPYFYMLYLTGDSPSSMYLGLAVFLPQLALLVLVSVKYYRDLPFSCFLHTFIFVMFNKVCTSQYFLWYLCLLPLIIPQVHMSIQEAGILITLWFLGQAVWLLPAYYLEFEGWNTFIYIWVAGFVFFIINIWILHRIIQTYRPLIDKQKNDKHFPTLYQIVGNVFTVDKKI